MIFDEVVLMVTASQFFGFLLMRYEQLRGYLFFLLVQCQIFISRINVLLFLGA